MGIFFETIGVVMTIVMPWVALALALAARQEAGENGEYIGTLFDAAEDTDSRLDTHNAFISDIGERLAAIESAAAASSPKAKH